MGGGEAGCSKASDNLVKAIDTRRRYPDNVFGEGWGTFHFFDADWIFEGAFVSKVSSLLDAEGSSCASLVNLDHDLVGSPRVFMIDRRSTDSDYRGVLRGTSPADGLIYAIERFGCTSDKGQWSIYCERQNEVAVFALRRGSSTEDYEPFLGAVCARRVTDVVAGGADFGFSEYAISGDWRAQLLEAYGR